MKKKNNMRARVQNFYKRWNYKHTEEEKEIEFRNRIITTIDKILGKTFLENDNLIRTYFRLIGQPLALSHTGLRYEVSTIQGKPFENSPVYNIFLSFTNINKTIQYTQALFWLGLGDNIKEALYKEINEDIELSTLSIRLKKTKSGNYILYPSGAKLLDENVVNDALDWLDDYPKVYDSFKSALEKYEKHKYTRNLIDDLRFSLESLLKKILHNRKGLENQTKPLGQYLKGKEVSKEIRNMFRELINEYGKYQNEHAKHNDSIGEFEVEFIIYLTGTFMRFILNLETSSAK